MKKKEKKISLLKGGVLEQPDTAVTLRGFYLTN
jgi:hypothetical protein